MKLEKEVYVDGFNLGNIGSSPGIAYYIHLSFEDSIEKASDYKKFEGRWAKITLEVEEPILDEAERKYLSDVIRPFRDNIKSIKKYGFSTGREYIHIETKDNDMMDMFPFKKGTMYKNLELNKEYTLKDLDL